MSMVAKHHITLVIAISCIILYITFCASKQYCLLDFIIIFVIGCNINNVHIAI